MDDTDDDSKYSPNPYCGVNHQQGFGSSNHQRVLVKCGNESVGDDDDEDNDEVVKDEEELGEHGEDNDDYDEDNDDDDNHGVQRIGYHAEYDEAVDDDHTENDFKTPVNVVNFKKHPNKRNLQSVIANYEFAPRVAVQSSGTNCVVRKRATSGRNPLTDWTEHETLVLLNAWGDGFVENQRKSRTDEWQEVADKVCEESKNHRTETQCRNRVDTLKKKYKKEKMKLAETGTDRNIIAAKWVFFTKMEGLMETSKPNLNVYENHANGCDDMRETGMSSESCESRGYQESDELPPKKKKLDSEPSCYSLIADSIHKFGQMYEKIEISKRQQMMEIEKMWMDLHADVEMQLREVIENSLNEIAGILRGKDGQCNGVSNENING